jgi:5-methylcytosine-specific restriction endonuclease McrA
MRKGEKMTDEMKQKISLSKKGQPSPNKGKVLSKEWKEKLSKAKKGKPSHWKGKIPSSETRELMRQAKLGKKQAKEVREKNKNSQLTRFAKIIPNYVPYTWQDKRRKTLRQAEGFHSNGEWETLKAQYNWTCPACHKPEPEILLTRDHIIPVSKGGSDNIENIQPLCRSCNSKKHSNTIKY